MARKRTVFTLIPGDKNFDKIYEEGIKETCSELGAECERVDEALFDQSLKVNTLTKITKADLVIADMSGSDPHIAFNAGYAKALNKKMIFLSAKESEISEEMKDSKHIIYSGDVENLKKKLEKELQESLEENVIKNDDLIWNKVMM